MDEQFWLYALMGVLSLVVTVLTCLDVTDKTGMSYHHALVGNERVRVAGVQTVEATAQGKKAQ